MAGIVVILWIANPNKDRLQEGLSVIFLGTVLSLTAFQLAIDATTDKNRNRQTATKATQGTTNQQYF